MAKSKEREAARKLRKGGLGIKIIAHRLQVSPSTVSLWCRDIVLTPGQILQLEQRAKDPHYGRRLAYAQKQRKIRAEKVQRLLLEGKTEINALTKRELFLSGIALYWAEGFKKDNLVGFANSDPAMLRFIFYWLESCCNVTPDRLKIRLGVNEQYRQKVPHIEAFWMKALDLKKEQFQKPFFQKVVWKKTYDHPEEYHGVLRIRVAKSTDLLRKIHGWIEGMKQDYRNTGII